MIYFTFREDATGKEIILPVPPQEMRVQTGKGLETVQVLNKGEVDFPLGARLWTVSFESFFPLYYDPTFCVITELLSPIKYVTQFCEWAENNKVIRLIVSNLINDLFYIQDFEYRLQGGNEGDIFYSITLRRYRKVKVNEKSVQISSTSTQERPDSRERPRYYIVQKGDTLSKIAQKYYENSKLWHTIYNINKKTIGPNPNLIKEGMKLILP